MIPLIVIGVLILPGLPIAPGTEDGEVAGLIKALGSTDAHVRESATKALKARPGASSAIRRALKSPDAEVSRIAADILEFYERDLKRELDAAIKEGKVERAIDLLADWWPEGKQDELVWDAASSLAAALNDRNQKLGGPTIDISPYFKGKSRKIISANRITQTTKSDFRPGRLMLRADAFDLDFGKPGGEPGKRPNRFASSRPVVISKGAVRVFFDNLQAVVFARGSVIIECGPMSKCIVVSGGDVTLDCIVSDSLVVAKGSVFCTGAIRGTRILSAKSVVCVQRPAGNSVITENEPNPLGYVQWGNGRAGVKEKSRTDGSNK